MNYRGQSFSTFQLLISAIIALAILTILLYILGLIKPPSTSEPNKIIAEVLNNAHKSKSTPLSGKIVFSKRDGYITITTQAILGNSDVGIESKQICLSPGVYMDETEFGRVEKPSKSWSAYEDGSLIRYNLDKKEVSVSVICGATATGLYKYLEETLYRDIKPEWMDSGSFKCKCLEDELLREQECCLVVLKYAS
ncbi:MAG: hypothetical protein N3F05_03290 [Candidatus Diapherotrites archaeon]|nr:hypothetical protein [Candidatus Diapherotrites archaeon]